MIPKDISAANFPEGSNARAALESIEARLNSPRAAKERAERKAMLERWMANGGGQETVKIVVDK